MVAKSSLSNFPVFKTFFTLQRAILIERPDCHLKADCKFLKPEGVTSTQQISRALEKKGVRVSLCPEGTIGAPGIIMRFHTSAFRQGYPVTPVCIKYHTFLPIAWTTHHWLSVLFNSLVNPFGFCEVKILNSLQKNENETFQEFADRVGELMAQELKYKYVHYSSQDWFYFSGKKDKGTDEYMRDFGWMGTLDEFCKKYKIWRWFGIKSYQVKDITLPVQQQDDKNGGDDQQNEDQQDKKIQDEMKGEQQQNNKNEDKQQQEQIIKQKINQMDKIAKKMD